jgi:hypothetical protein
LQKKGETGKRDRERGFPIRNEFDKTFSQIYDDYDKIRPREERIFLIFVPVVHIEQRIAVNGQRSLCPLTSILSPSGERRTLRIYSYLKVICS